MDKYSVGLYQNYQLLAQFFHFSRFDIKIAS